MLRPALFMTIALISGCSSFGNSDFACPGMPNGVSCTPTRDLYNATNGGELPRASHGQSASVSARDPDNKSDQVVKSEPVTDAVIDTFVTPTLPDRPVPIRTPSQVMRIWISSWEDTDSGSLVSPGYVYTEIEPRRWVLGKPESAAEKHDRLFRPLEQSRSTTPQ